MNIKNILEIARALIDERARFDMMSAGFNRDCGSAGCIASHIAYLHPRKRLGIRYWNGHGKASDLTIQSHFRISPMDAENIFIGAGSTGGLKSLTRWTAAAALVRYARTSMVDFSRASKSRAISMVEAAEREFLK